MALDRQLAERDGEAIERQLMALMVTFRDRADDPAIVIKAYRLALSDLSSAAVIEAINRFVRGRVERAAHAFAPSAAEIHIEATRIQWGMQQELDLIQHPPSPAPPRLIGRPVSAPRVGDLDVFPEERNRIASGLDALVQELTCGLDMRRADSPPPRVEAQS